MGNPVSFTFNSQHGPNFFTTSITRCTRHMSQTVGGPQERIEETVRNADGHVEQTELVDTLTASDHDEREILETIRVMMEQNKLSYNVDWEIQLEE